MIADLPRKGNIEIPIYLADSIMVEKATLSGRIYVLKTIAGEFQLPASIVEKELLPGILSEVVSALRSRYTTEDFKNRVRYRFKEISGNEIYLLGRFYETLLKTLLELEQEGKNDIWASMMRNAFAPTLKGKLDHVVGNLPWAVWESLPDEYREVTKLLWENTYGLVGGGAGKFKGTWLCSSWQGALIYT